MSITTYPDTLTTRVDDTSTVNVLYVGTAQDKLDIADAILDEMLSGHTTAGSLGAEIKKKLDLGQFIALQK